MVPNHASVVLEEQVVDETLAALERMLNRALEFLGLLHLVQAVNLYPIGRHIVLVY